MSKMRHWVLVDNHSGTVENLVDWDGPDAPGPFEQFPFTTPFEYFEGDKNVCLGATYKDGVFSVDDKKNDYIARLNDGLLSYNQDMKSILLKEASRVIAILNTLVTLEINLDDDAARLPLWQKYQASVCQEEWRKKDRKVIWPQRPLLPSYLRDLYF